MPRLRSAIWLALLAAGCSQAVATDGGGSPACNVTCAVGTHCAANRCAPDACGPTQRCAVGLVCAAGFCTDQSCEPPCPAGQVCLDQLCLAQAAPNNASDAGGQGCAAPYVACQGAVGDYCANLLRDSSNCGGCGNTCPAGSVCNGAGLCAASCVAAETLCGDRCFDLQTDNDNCGACGSACTASQVCGNGACATACPAPTVACSGYCANPASDPGNCGGCGRGCDPGQACFLGLCAPACAFTLCPPSPPGTSAAPICVDPAFDDQNCGGCGNACAAGSRCLQGSCLPCGTAGALCCLGATCQGPLLCEAATCQVPFPPTALGSVLAATGSDGRIYLYVIVEQNNGREGPIPSHTLLAYDPIDGTVTQLPTDPDGYNEGSALAADSNGHLFIVGGYEDSPDGGMAADRPGFGIYDLARQTWSAGPALPDGRGHLGAACGLDGRFYVFGGSNGGPPVSDPTTSIYDPDAGTWSAGTPDPTARDGEMAARAPDGRIYVVGGGPYSQAESALIEIYDPQSDTWIADAGSLPGTAGFGSAAFGADGRLYALGIFGSPANAILIFDPATGQGTTLALPTPSASQTFALTTGPGGGPGDGGADLFLFGGTGDGVGFGYQASTDTWW